MTKVHEANQNYPFEQLSLANPHGIQGGAFFSKLLLNEEHPCLFQTPKCLTKNGIVRTGKKTYCDLIIASNNDTFLNFLQEFEKWQTGEHIYLRDDISKDCVAFGVGYPLFFIG